MNIRRASQPFSYSYLDAKNYKEDFLKKWRESKLDACICPGFAFPAVPSGKVTNVVGYNKK
jgi:hypothetical protein